MRISQSLLFFHNHFCMKTGRGRGEDINPETGRRGNGRENTNGSTSSWSSLRAYRDDNRVEINPWVARLAGERAGGPVVTASRTTHGAFLTQHACTSTLRNTSPCKQPVDQQQHLSSRLTRPYTMLCPGRLISIRASFAEDQKFAVARDAA